MASTKREREPESEPLDDSPKKRQCHAIYGEFLRTAMELDDFKDDLLTPLQKEAVTHLEKLIATRTMSELIQYIRIIKKDIPLPAFDDGKATWVKLCNSPVVDELLNAHPDEGFDRYQVEKDFGARYGVTSIIDDVLDTAVFIRGIILSGNEAAFDFVSQRCVDFSLNGETIVKWALQGKSAAILRKTLEYNGGTKFDANLLDHVRSAAVAEEVMTHHEVKDRARVLALWGDRPLNTRDADFWVLLFKLGFMFDKAEEVYLNESWLVAMVNRDVKFPVAVINAWMKAAVRHANASLVKLLCECGATVQTTAVFNIHNRQVYRVLRDNGCVFRASDLMDMLQNIINQGADFEWLEELLKDGHRFPPEAISTMARTASDHRHDCRAFTLCVRRCLRLLLESGVAIPRSMADECRKPRFTVHSEQVFEVLTS